MFDGWQGWKMWTRTEPTKRKHLQMRSPLDRTYIASFRPSITNRTCVLGSLLRKIHSEERSTVLQHRLHLDVPNGHIVMTGPYHQDLVAKLRTEPPFRPSRFQPPRDLSCIVWATTTLVESTVPLEPSVGFGVCTCTSLRFCVWNHEQQGIWMTVRTFSKQLWPNSCEWWDVH